MSQLFSGKDTVALFSVVIISLAGNIITIGDKAMQIHPWVGWGFYIVLWLFVLRFIVWPTLRFIFTPSLRGDERERLSQMEPAEVERYAKNLGLNQQERLLVSAAATTLEGVEQVLKCRDEEAEKIVRGAALNVFVVTAISQNGSFDIITAFGLNVQMINRLVATRHRRPSLAQLLELYVSILSATLIIGLTDDLLDEIDAEQILGSAVGGVAKTLIASSVNGAMNAYLTLRVGKMTMKYLEMGSRYFKQNRQKIRKQARKQALREIPSIAKSGVESLSAAMKTSAKERFSSLNPLKKTTNDSAEF